MKAYKLNKSNLSTKNNDDNISDIQIELERYNYNPSQTILHNQLPRSQSDDLMMPEHSFNKNLQREVQFNPQEFDENHHQQVQEAPLQQNDKGIQSMNVLKEQIKVFAIVYVSYIYIHIYREFWSMSKKALLQQSHSKFDEETLASFDTAYLFVYSVATFVGGVVGDIYDLRKLLSFSMFMLSLSYFALGLGGYSDIEDPAYYYYFLIVNFIIKEVSNQ